jgi:hypothetical protein
MQRVRAADDLLLQKPGGRGEATMLRPFVEDGWIGRRQKKGGAVIYRSVSQGANVVCWVSMGKGVR